MRKMTRKEFDTTIDWLVKEKGLTNEGGYHYLEIIFDLTCRYRKACEECREMGCYITADEYNKVADRLELILKEHEFYESL